MVRGFNDFNKEDQERLFWLLGFLMLFLIFLLIIIPLSITDSQTLIKDGLTSDAFVIDMYERDGTFEYDVKYAVSNGDTLIATLELNDYYEIGESIYIYYSKTNEFFIREFSEVNSYVKTALIMSLIWIVILCIALFTIIRPKVVLNLLDGKYKIIKTGPNNGEHS
jgi:hypothetical protein